MWVSEIFYGDFQHLAKSFRPQNFCGAKTAGFDRWNEPGKKGENRRCDGDKEKCVNAEFTRECFTVERCMKCIMPLEET
jgi:hypothetical protein